MIVALITIAVILILYGAVSKPLDARGITSAMIFTAAGLAVGTSALKLVNIHARERSPRSGSASSPSSSCCSATRRVSTSRACADIWAGPAGFCSSACR